MIAFMRFNNTLQAMLPARIPILYGLWAVWHCVVSGARSLVSRRQYVSQRPGIQVALRRIRVRQGQTRGRQFHLSAWQFALSTGNIREGPD